MPSLLVILSIVFGCAAAFPLTRRPPALLSAAGAAGLLAVRLGPAPQLPVLLIAAEVGVLLALTDLRSLRLPDPLVATLAFGVGPPLALLTPYRIVPALAAALLTGAGYLALALLPGRGLGFGDVKLGAVLALLLGLLGGWPAVVTGIGSAHLLGGLTAIYLLVTRRGRVFPFGPALLLGALTGVLVTAA
ncbi:prepilin peptidase [Actinoplanes awajinensis]|uniref:prepilin peptidase n=1 Tax=Actinoplanes awajinensis TaxID=135946 RepID=UPI001E55971D|nr:prepilin peptidase [Actinoplanes awajinensis]